MVSVDKVVDEFTAAEVAWAEAGASPYLGAVDAPTNTISTFTNTVREGIFKFVDFDEALFAAITSVKLYIVMRSQDIEVNSVVADVTHGTDLSFTNLNANMWETFVDDLNTELFGRFTDLADLNTFGVTYRKVGALTITIDEAFLRIVYTSGSVLRRLIVRIGL